MSMKQFTNQFEAQTLALAIVDTLPEPFVVLDDELRVVAANRGFYELVGEDAEHTRERPLLYRGQSQQAQTTLRRGECAGLRSW
jgi:PAS domain-containing protein